MSIKFNSYGDTTGYGLAGYAYLRGLLNLGLSVYWRPVFWGAKGLQFWRPSMTRSVLEIVRTGTDDPSLRDVHAVMDLTAEPREYHTVVSHVIPEYLPSCLETGKRNIAYCTWESDTIPEQWPGILNQFDAVLVPCHFNAEVFRAGGVTAPIHVVPHIRRHAIEDVTAAQRAELRRKLGIEKNQFVFYSIGAWQMRKDFPRLIQAFLEEFSLDEQVVLVLKSSTKPVHSPLPHEEGKTSVQLIKEVVEAVNTRQGKSGAKIMVMAGDGVSGTWLDCLHQMGDAYVSLSHAEGWGMGAFDAALLGRPVLITGWGGVLDFLGDDYPGLIQHSLEHIDWPGTTFEPHHRWAVADVDDARTKMRDLFERRGQPDVQSMHLSEQLCNRFSEAKVMAQFREILRC